MAPEELLFFRLASSASMQKIGIFHTNAPEAPEFPRKWVLVAPGITHVTPTPDILTSLCNASAKLHFFSVVANITMGTIQ